MNVAALLDSLLVYGTGALRSTSLALAYDVNTIEDIGLMLLLEESGVMTETRLRVVEAELGFDDGDEGDGAGSSLEAAFQASERVARVVVVSPALHEVLKDVAELKGGGSVAVSFTPAAAGPPPAQHARFRLHLPAPGGSLTVDIPGNSPEVLSMSVKGVIEHRYATSLLEAALRGLNDSFQTLFRVNAKGVLSVTHKLGSDRDVARGGAGGGIASVGLFVTTLILPDELDDEEAAAQDDDVGGGAQADD